MSDTNDNANSDLESTTDTELDNSANNDSASDSETKNSNHIAGCSIFIVILLTVIFIISICFYTYFDYKKAIVNITEETQNETLIADTSNEALNKALVQKFQDFSTLVMDKQPASLTLSIQEINLAITQFEKLHAFKGKLYVTELEASPNHENDRIITRASLPMSPGFDDERYMNGTLEFRPEIAEGSIFPIIEEASPDTGSPVPPKMMQALSTLMFTEYRNDESIKDVFHRITTAQVIDNQLVITSDPANQTVAIIDRTITDERKKSVKYLIFLFIFIFSTSIAFALWYKKFKRKQSEE